MSWLVDGGAAVTCHHGKVESGSHPPSAVTKVTLHPHLPRSPSPLILSAFRIHLLASMVDSGRSLPSLEKEVGSSLACTLLWVCSGS